MSSAKFCPFRLGLNVSTHYDLNKIYKKLLTMFMKLFSFYGENIGSLIQISLNVFLGGPNGNKL